MRRGASKSGLGIMQAVRGRFPEARSPEQRMPYACIEQKLRPPGSARSTRGTVPVPASRAVVDATPGHCIAAEIGAAAHHLQPMSLRCGGGRCSKGRGPLRWGEHAKWPVSKCPGARSRLSRGTRRSWRCGSAPPVRASSMRKLCAGAGAGGRGDPGVGLPLPGGEPFGRPAGAARGAR